MKLVYQLVITYEENLVSSLESQIIFDERFTVTSIAFFIDGFNLLRATQALLSNFEWPSQNLKILSYENMYFFVRKYTGSREIGPKRFDVEHQSY